MPRGCIAGTAERRTGARRAPPDGTAPPDPGDAAGPGRRRPGEANRVRGGPGSPRPPPSGTRLVPGLGWRPRAARPGTEPMAQPTTYEQCFLELVNHAR